MHIKKKSECVPFDSGKGEVVYELIGHVAGGSDKYSLAHVELLPGASSMRHSHPIAEESYYILKSEGELIIDGESKIVKPGQAIAIPPLQTHQIFNRTKDTLEFLTICMPAWTPDCSTAE